MGGLRLTLRETDRGGGRTFVETQITLVRRAHNNDPSARDSGNRKERRSARAKQTLISASGFLAAKRGELGAFAGHQKTGRFPCGDRHQFLTIDSRYRFSINV